MVFPGILGFSTVGLFVYHKRKSSGWDEQCLAISHPHKAPSFNESFSSSEFKPKEYDFNEPPDNFYQPAYLEPPALLPLTIKAHHS
jgi:hypothetical protein